MSPPDAERPGPVTPVAERAAAKQSVPKPTIQPAYLDGATDRYLLNREAVLSHSGHYSWWIPAHLRDDTPCDCGRCQSEAS